MPSTAIKRVDLQALDQKPQAAADTTESSTGAASPMAIRWLIFPVSVFLCIAQAVATIFASNLRSAYLATCMVPIVAFAVLFFGALLVNPFLRLLRPVSTKLGGVIEWVFRPFGRAEMLCIFTAMAVTAGISTFGLTEQLVPLIASPFNPAWNTKQSGWDEKLVPAMKHNLYIEDPQAIRQFREGISNTDVKNFKQPVDGASMSEWSGYAWRVFRVIPWNKWAAPLAWWMVFVGASYLMFYSLTYVVLGYWADREKLIFPIARLSESLLPDANGIRWLSPTMRSPGFWGGCLFVMAILSWNALAPSGIFYASVSPIPLGMGPGDFNSAINNTFLAGMGAGAGRGMPDSVPGFLIMFTAIGLAFLLPLEISFSVWFYYVVSRFSFLAATWMGFGRNVRDFPSDWLGLTNHVTSQAAGGFLFFCTVSLWRCLRDYRLLTKGKPWKEKLIVGIPVLGLVVSLVVIVTWLQWNNLPLIWATLFTLLLVLITIGLMRIVSEAGVYWFQVHTSFFHIYKVFGIGYVLSPVLVGPLLPICSVLFLDTKTFMAPSLVTSASMAKEAQVGRFKFHLNLILCIIISVLVSLVTAILLAHVIGGNQMNGWFYGGGPKSMMETAALATSNVPHFEKWNIFWYGFGAIWVGASMYLRTMFFWFPHPVGYIMLINPLLSQLWFPFLLGWIAKRIVVKYGGKATFDRVRNFFIGLIMGELLSITIWTGISLIFKISGLIMPSINRYN